MKLKSLKNIWILSLAILLVAFGACKEDELDFQELNAQKLVKGWQIGQSGSARFDLTSITSEFTDFQITFSGDKNGGAYTTSGGQDVFDASGTWTFVPENPNGIRLTGNKAAAGKNVTMVFSGARLILDFTVSGSSASNFSPGNRVESLAGNYRFELETR
ncbi:hypothetical protein ACFCT7_11585 [Fulvivirgaceae bacterium LMO-SS25]